MTATEFMKRLRRSGPTRVLALALTILAGHGVDRARADDDETTAEFLMAVWTRDLDRVEAFLQDDPSLADAESESGTALQLAVFAKPGAEFIRPEENPLVAAITARGPKLNVFEAALLGDADLLRNLVEADPALAHTPFRSGWTPLHCAAFSGSVECVRYLLDRGASVHVRAMPSSKITPLQSGLFTRRHDVTRLLLERGADVLVRAKRGFTPLHEAALLGDTDLIRLLVDHGAELDSRTDEGKTALAIALERDRGDAAELLRRLGAED